MALLLVLWFQGEPTFISSFFFSLVLVLSHLLILFYFSCLLGHYQFFYTIVLTRYFALVFGVYLSSHSFVSSDERGSITTVMTVYGRRCFLLLFSLWPAMATGLIDAATLTKATNPTPNRKYTSANW